MNIDHEAKELFYVYVICIESENCLKLNGMIIHNIRSFPKKKKRNFKQKLVATINDFSF